MKSKKNKEESLKPKKKNKEESLKPKKENKEEQKVKKTKLFVLKISKIQLIHLRDVLSILFPSADEKTLSQSLAAAEQRTFEESSLWKKIASLCVNAEVPIDDEAPDYALVPVGHAPMGVFMIGQDEEQQTKLPFLKAQSEDLDSDDHSEKM